VSAVASGSSGWKDAATGAALATAAFLIYFFTRQPTPVQDGFIYIERLSIGDYRYNHILYLPAVAAFRWLLAPIAEPRADSLLTIFSSLFGGLSVAACYFFSRTFFGSSKGKALAATMLFAFLPGTWFHATVTGLYIFHAAFATVAAMVLFRFVAADRKASFAWTTALFALLPASHLAGGAVAGPALVAGWRARRLQFAAGSLAAGFAIFFVAYFLLKSGSSHIQGYESAQIRDFYLRQFLDPLGVPSLVLKNVAELFVFSTPASALFPAGMIVLFRQHRAWAWIVLAWMASYILLCSVLETRLYGCYYLSTYAMQACVAILALESLSGVYRFAACLVAIAAGAGLLASLSMEAQLGLCAAASLPIVGLLVVSRCSERAHRSEAALALPGVSALLLTGLGLVPQQMRTPPWFEHVSSSQQDEIRRANSAIPPAAKVLITESDPFVAAYWHHKLVMERPDSYFLVVRLDTEPREVAEPQALAIAGMLDDLARRGEAVYAVGDESRFQQNSRAAAFMDGARARLRFEPAAGAPRGLAKILRKEK
jgi:hypothetical protein